MLRELSSRIRLVALDIDGTITVDRRAGEFELELDVVKAIRELERSGIKVSGRVKDYPKNWIIELVG